MAKKRKVVDVEAADKESLLTPAQRQFIADWRKQHADELGRNQIPLEKRPDKREEKLSWVARNKPGMEKRIRQMMGTLFYNPKRHEKT